MSIVDRPSWFIIRVYRNMVYLVSGLSHELDAIFGLPLSSPAATNPILCVITPYSALLRTGEVNKNI